MDAIIIGPDGSWYSSKHAKYDSHGNVITKQCHKRYRATVVIIRDGKVLLVRDGGKHDYSMPGGGFNKHENTIQAGAREVWEELGIKAESVLRLRHCDFHGQRSNHKVCQLMISDNQKPYLKSKEIDRIVWWDMKSKLKVQGHVIKILKTLKYGKGDK